MNSMSIGTRLLLALVALGACLVIGYQASATRQTISKPVSAAVVDLEKIFDALKERSAEDVRLQALAENRKQEDSTWFNLLQQMEAQLANTPATSTNYEPQQREWIKKSLEYEAWKNFTVREIDREKSLILQKLYRSVKKEIEALAQLEGYDIVFLNDSVRDIQSGTEQQTTLQISARRILYAANAIDITIEVITRMNNAFTGATSG